LKGNSDEKTVIVFSPRPDDETISASAHACFEIGVEWFLFFNYSKNALIEQIHNGSLYTKTDLKPFFTILGTSMRAKREKSGYLNNCVFSVFTIYSATAQLRRD
jgi:hypothetical protein